MQEEAIAQLSCTVKQCFAYLSASAAAMLPRCLYVAVDSIDKRLNFELLIAIAGKRAIG